MITPNFKVSNLIALIFILLFNTSCSKDTDLLLDSVIADSSISELEENEKPPTFKKRRKKILP